MSVVLSIKGLSVGFHKKGGDKVLIKDFSDELVGGQLVSILGLNGSGKTTLLRTLIGREPELAGTVFFDGKELEAIPLKELSKKVAVVMTERNVPGLMLTQDIVALGRSPYTGLLGKLSAKDEQMVEWAMNSTGAEGLVGRRVGELSDGEKQKVLLARALAQDTPIIILDEPNTFLDLKNRVMIFKKAVELCKENGKTILLSTHDLQLALEMSDRLWVIGPDQQIFKGSTSDMIEENIISQTFDDQYIKFNKENLSFNIKKS